MPKFIRTKPRTAERFPAETNHRSAAALRIVALQINKNLKQANIDQALALEEHGFQCCVFSAYEALVSDEFSWLSVILEHIEFQKEHLKSQWSIRSEGLGGDLTTPLLVILNWKGYDVLVSPPDDDEYYEYVFDFGKDPVEDDAVPNGWTLYKRKCD